MPIRILVVDDMPINRNLIGHLLEKEHYIIFYAVDGVEAIQRVYEIEPDVMIMDFYLPKMNGMQIAKIMKSNPKTASIPMIMLTSESDYSKKVDALMNGVDDVFTRSTAQKYLVSRLESMLKWRKKMIPICENYISDRVIQERSKLLFISKRLQVLQYFEEFTKDIPLKFQCIDYSVLFNSSIDSIREFSLIILAVKTRTLLKFYNAFMCKKNPFEIPIMMIVKSYESTLLKNSLYMGIADYLIMPFEKQELFARCMNQLRYYTNAKIDTKYHKSSFQNTDVVKEKYTHKDVEEHINRIINSSRISNFMILRVDIDSFRDFNDEYNHSTGNMLLKKITKIITTNMKTVTADICARFVKEGFIILLKDVEIKNCIDITERLINAIRNASIKFIDHKTKKETILSITYCSIGGKYFNHPVSNTSYLLNSVDNNLSLAKAMGRNCYVIN